jgi:hypothetical protein
MAGELHFIVKDVQTNPSDLDSHTTSIASGYAREWQWCYLNRGNPRSSIIEKSDGSLMQSVFPASVDRVERQHLFTPTPVNCYGKTIDSNWIFVDMPP